MQDLSQELVDLATKDALVIAQSKLWKEKLKAQLAVIQMSLIDQGMPVTRAEVAAKASPEYLEKLRVSTEIVMKAEVAYAKRKSIEMRHDYERATESTKRAEMKMI